MLSVIEGVSSDTPSFGLFLAPDHVHERHDVGDIHFPIVVQVGVGQLVLVAAHHYTHEHLRVGVVHFPVAAQVALRLLLLCSEVAGVVGSAVDAGVGFVGMVSE